MSKATGRTGILGDCVGEAGGLLAAAGRAGLTALARRITGFGDYKVDQNSLTGAGAGSIPTFGSDSIRITRKEYLGDVGSTINFTNTVYNINPGDPTTFPWLSVMAKNFEEYEMHGCVFSFVSTSAVALTSTNPGLGKVLMATEYNVSAAAFANSRSMLATLFSNYGKPSNDLSHAIECRRGETLTRSLLLRKSGVIPAGGNAQFYDLGKFQFATEGMQSASNIGGLWVTYDVTLRKPILEEDSTDPLLTSIYIEDLEDFKTAPIYNLSRFDNNLDLTWSYTNSGGVFSITGTFPAALTGYTFYIQTYYYNPISSPTATGPGVNFTYVLSGLSEEKWFKAKVLTNIKSNGTPNNTFTNQTAVIVTASGIDRATFTVPLTLLPTEYSELEIIVSSISPVSSVLQFTMEQTLLSAFPRARGKIQEDKKSDDMLPDSDKD